MRHLQAIIIIFCLGIFLVPKDNFYAQATKDNCCKKEQMSNCCKKDTPSKKPHQKKHSSCKDNCCNFCATCFSFITSPFSENLKLKIPYYKANKNLEYQYSTPYISDRLKEIWQPPKLV